MNVIEKVLSTVKIADVSVATTIAVTCLGAALIMSVYQNNDPTTTNTIAGGLMGYIGGRTLGGK